MQINCLKITTRESKGVIPMKSQHLTLGRISEAQERALNWLYDAGQSGIVDRYGRVVASGEAAKFADASTWLRLIADEFVEGKDKRLRITPRGRSYVHALEDMGIKQCRASHGGGSPKYPQTKGRAAVAEDEDEPHNLSEMRFSRALPNVWPRRRRAWRIHRL